MVIAKCIDLPLLWMAIIMPVCAGLWMGGCRLQSHPESSQSMDMIFADDFNDGMDSWWIEGSDRVEVQRGRLYINANGQDQRRDRACTVWCRYLLAEVSDFKLEFDAYVIDSALNCNNINFFLAYSMPDGADLHATRMERVDGEYQRYHDLNGYIFTYVQALQDEPSHGSDGSIRGRLRIRKCPGFALMAERYGHDAAGGKRRHIEISFNDGMITFSVDRMVQCQVRDAYPWTRGHFGFRTYMTHLWVDNFKITKLGQ